MDAPARSDRPNSQPMTLGLAIFAVALVVAMTVAFQFASDANKVWNLSVVGALALFAAARLGGGYAVVFTLGAVALKDVCLYALTNWWEPAPAVFVGFALYIALGYAFLRNTESPLRIGGIAVGASLLFFFVTNFAAWVEQALPYGYSLEGLWNCMVAGIPFARGTFFGDLVFTGALFGAHAALSRAYFPAERVAPAATEGEVVR
jgi:hypothetical protein